MWPIEVEYVPAALELAARGLGDTLSSRQLIAGSPATREFIRLAEPRWRRSSGSSNGP